jgi:5'-3' exonuclease
MGIPAYFSYILKTHANILKSLSHIKGSVQFDHLYMDCNSIIYDSYRELIEQNVIDPDFDVIIEKTIYAIQIIINIISPSKTIFIAFDGVAPMAKMEQQKLRRYRNTSLNTTFNTTMITPGTKFMKLLTKRVYDVKWTCLQSAVCIVSGADKVGEGEHKMMEHIRNNNTHPTDTFAIYGLDSDLIMLAICHFHLTKKLFIFREAQEFFISKIPIKFSHKREPYFIDIQEMIHSIQVDIGNVYDYVFLCFFLGNDFLPHFPTLSLRTHGIQRLIDVYNQLPNKYRNLVSVGQHTKPFIHWKSVFKLLQILAKHEHEFILQEYTHREHQSKRHYSEKTEEEKDVALLNSPTICRGDELYICPTEYGWENRYYKLLFKMKFSDEKVISEISKNYLEGLEWVFDYYTQGTNHPRWKYKYNFPPLLKDLYKYCPNDSKSHFFYGKEEPYSINEQLLYILPPVHLKNEGITPLCDGDVTLRYEMAFCKYLWEAKIDFNLSIK